LESLLYYTNLTDSKTAPGMADKTAHTLENAKPCLCL